jgi:tetratricopeptide (TPR) repeat protein
MTAIVGLGGVGKTQIALEVAYRMHETDPECSIFWVPALNSTSFEQAYREIGRKLQVDGIEEGNADVKSLVKAALSQEGSGRWLLVVDNADDLELLYGDKAIGDSVTGPCLARFLPFGRKGSILFTTRNHKVAVRLAAKNVINVGSMEIGEAHELLETNLNAQLIGDTESTTRLLDLLANLPLAIKQASAYMNENQISIAEYLKIYESDDDEMIYLLSQEFEDLGRYDNIKNPIAKTWLISFRQILHTNPLAADYLRFMSFLAEQDIPRSLFAPDWKAKTTEAIGTLKAYKFITEREHSGSYDIHRLVQVSARYWLKESGEWDVWATKALRHLAKAFPSPKHENRDVWMRYIPHTQYVLKFRKGADDGEAERDLLFNVGESFHLLGKYQEAENMHRQALELREKALGKEHPDTLMSMNNLAAVLRQQGKYEEAEQMHRQTLGLRERVLGKEHPNTLTSMNNLAIVLNRQGKYEEAEQMHRQTLELRERVLGKEHPDTLASMNNLANVLNRQGKYEEAEQMHRHTLVLGEGLLGKEHPDTLASMNNLAIVLDEQGKYEGAEQMHRQTLELRERVLGKEHPDTLASMNNLAIVLQRQGKYEGAEQMYRQTLELRERVLGKEHPDTLMSMNNLANVLQLQEKYEEAEQMYRQTLKLKERVLGKEHPNTLMSMNNLANVLRRQGKYEEAEQMHR